MLFFFLMEYIIGRNYFSGRIFMAIGFRGKVINCFFFNSKWILRVSCHLFILE